MKAMTTQFEGLADRAGFNASVRHIKSTLGILDRVADKENLADVLAELGDQGSLSKDQFPAVVSMVLGDKYGYRAVAANLRGAATDIAAIAEEVSGWNGVDLVVVYHHPDLGVLVVNPKNKARISTINRVNRSELMTVWAGRFAKEGDPALLDATARAVIELFSGKTIKPKAEFLKGDCAYKQAASAEGKPAKGKADKAATAKAATATAAKAAAKGVPSKAKAAVKAPAATVEAAAPEPEHKPAVEAERAIKPGSKMTPMYSVPVTNELFHNGNVEAWKRIIASYNSKHPDLTVLVYYDGERITNLNALFKWGKVKHGSTIQFAVAGDEISDVAKLQRYLAQGASRMYEAFLRGPVNSVMVLF
ncbi:MAG TPA: hypothetical protein VMV83_09170 [Rectinemataceae bacterium]|nr:hypothetical protein [Rectinemataceae bacterium]